MSDLARTSYNYIDKLDFLAEYPRARIEAFKPQTIQTSFAATGLTPIDPERVLSKLNISLESLHTPTPPASRPSSRSSQFTPKTPKTAIQLRRQSTLVKKLLKQRSNSPPSPSKSAIDQIIKSAYLSMHTVAILAQENADLRRANEKKRQKRTRSNRHIALEEGRSIGEGLQLAQQPEQLVEDSQVISYKAGESANQADLPRRRAPQRCSGCRELGHRITRCNKR